MKNGVKTFKSRNLVWLMGILILDILVLLVFAFPTAIEDFTPTNLVATRVSLTSLLPIPALILSSLISAHYKAIFVFWRFKHPLPGSRAFSVYAPADDRIDLVALRKNIGEFPVTARDQNSKWYGLYRQVATDFSIIDSHRNYLLFRDIAALSLLLVFVLPIVMFFSGVDASRILISTILFLSQYLVTALAARTTGIRLVQNVLALHASQKAIRSRTTQQRPRTD